MGSSQSKPIVSLHGDNPAEPFKIEKGIPYARTNSSGATEAARRLLRDGEIGDSMVFPGRREGVYSTFERAGGKGRITVSKAEGGWRVWKIS